MKSIVVLEIDHDEPIPALAQMVSGRAWNVPGVKHAEVVPHDENSPIAVKAGVQALLDQGFTFAEISLGLTEVHR